jgi:hypothetical protein
MDRNKQIFGKPAINSLLRLFLEERYWQSESETETPQGELVTKFLKLKNLINFEI